MLVAALISRCKDTRVNGAALTSPAGLHVHSLLTLEPHNLCAQKCSAHQLIVTQLPYVAPALHANDGKV